ncbi:MAG: PEP-CTERM sorting domain-containing protein [Hyphomicrobiales bacterium]|nr:PEP-CTERM sorting domain-containing protein [Hyphomicrobiales bacterium]
MNIRMGAAIAAGILELAAAAAAHAQHTQVAVDETSSSQELIGTPPTVTKFPDSGLTEFHNLNVSGPAATSVDLKGDIAQDLNVELANKNQQTGTFNITTAPGKVALSANYKVAGPTNSSLLTAITAHTDYGFFVEGLQPGQSLTFHDSVSLTGAASVTTLHNLPGSHTTALSDLLATGAQDPYFGSVVTQAAAATLTDVTDDGFDIIHSDFGPLNSNEISARVQSNGEVSFQVGLELDTQLLENTSESIDYSASYLLNLGSSGYFTLDDANGFDTGIRFDARNLKIISDEGFNFFATSAPGGGDGGAVPEPASWALMITGFGACAMLRRRFMRFMA